MTRIAVFASGSGTNAQNLIEHLTQGSVELVLCNNPQAYVLQRAAQFHVPSYCLSPQEFTAEQPQRLMELLDQYRIDCIILAGFLLKVPQALIDRYPSRILNIHPALLPKYGGKGMYGSHVHRAVVAAGETLSGITVHLVDPLYDHGRILFQASCRVTPQDTPERLAEKIHALEQAHFPTAVDNYLLSLPHNAL